jgi:hypothetical protein
MTPDLPLQIAGTRMLFSTELLNAEVDDHEQRGLQRDVPPTSTAGMARNDRTDDWDELSHASDETEHVEVRHSEQARGRARR